MADDPKKPKVGVYDDDHGDTEVAEKKGGGVPSWVIALIVVALIVLAIVLFF